MKASRFVFATICIFCGFLLTWVNIAKAAGPANITIEFSYSDGSPVAGQEVSCYSRAPKGSNPVAPPPQYTYLTASTSGVVVWKPNVTEGYTYSCSNRTALTPDMCYQWSGATTGLLLLEGGESLSYSFKAGSTKASTCNEQEDQQEPSQVSSPAPQKPEETEPQATAKTEGSTLITQSEETKPQAETTKEKEDLPEEIQAPDTAADTDTSKNSDGFDLYRSLKFAAPAAVFVVAFFFIKRFR